MNTSFHKLALPSRGSRGWARLALEVVFRQVASVERVSTIACMRDTALAVDHGDCSSWLNLQQYLDWDIGRKHAASTRGMADRVSAEGGSVEPTSSHAIATDAPLLPRKSHG